MNSDDDQIGRAVIELDDLTGRKGFVDHHGDEFFIRTNDKGRNFRLVRAPVADPAPISDSRGWLRSSRRRGSLSSPALHSR